MATSLRHIAMFWLLMPASTELLLAQKLSPAQESAAQVVQLQGQVSILKDGGLWALNTGDHVQMKQVIVTGPDGFAVFRLSDGSTFEVYPNSQLTFRSNPGNWRDLLDLWMGRVKVQIQKWGGQPNLNRVQTPTAVISVRGTVFEAVVEDDAATTLIAVEEGQVAVQHALMPRGNPVILNAGESLRVYRNQPLAARSGFDREAVVSFALRALREALYTILVRTPKTSGGITVPGGQGPTLPGDTPSELPPAPRPPATPPPPPPGGGV